MRLPQTRKVPRPPARRADRCRWAGRSRTGPAGCRTAGRSRWWCPVRSPDRNRADRNRVDRNRADRRAASAAGRGPAARRRHSPGPVRGRAGQMGPGRTCRNPTGSDRAGRSCHIRAADPRPLARRGHSRTRWLATSRCQESARNRRSRAADRRSRFGRRDRSRIRWWGTSRSRRSARSCQIRAAHLRRPARTGAGHSQRSRTGPGRSQAGLASRRKGQAGQPAGRRAARWRHSPWFRPLVARGVRSGSFGRPQ